MKQIKRALIYLIQLAFQTFTNTSFRGLLVSLEIVQQAPKRSTLIYYSAILLQPHIRGGENTLNPIQQTDAGVFITAMQYMVPHFIGSAILLLLSLATPHTA